MRLPLLLLALAWAYPNSANSQNPEVMDKRPALMEGQLQAGGRAPDFRLKMRGSEEFVQLAGYQGRKPVLLYFGSFT